MHSAAPVVAFVMQSTAPVVASVMHSNAPVGAFVMSSYCSVVTPTVALLAGRPPGPCYAQHNYILRLSPQHIHNTASGTTP